MRLQECGVKDCPNPHRARGYCNGHYQRWRKTGDVKADTPLSKSHYGDSNPKWRGGKSGHPLYDIYYDMVGRCTRDTHHHYLDYGGRGISVHPEWAEDFWAFVRDVGERPEGTTEGGRAYWQLDRIDNDGNYEPGNVRWASPVQQRLNTRPKRLQERCRRNHEMTDENTKFYRNGTRRCKKCVRINEYNRTRARKRRGEID